MNILGIETSCDETAVAILTDQQEIKSHIVASQLNEHRPFGGVVPEIAARAHFDILASLLEQSLEESSLTLKEIDLIAATGGPGLIGGVIVGVMTAKALAAFHQKPFVAVNHLEAHALTVRLTHNVPFPYLLLLVSGGHCQLLIVQGVGKYTLLGTTLDDAVGEAFDKTARLLGLGYPGGPLIEKAALHGDPKAYPFPRPLLHKPGCSFSFSGLKTAVRLTIEACGPALDEKQVADIAASFQAAAADVLFRRTQNALRECEARNVPIRHLVVAGGVAANQSIKEKLQSLESLFDVTLIAPPLNLCTDNGAMVAWAGYERFKEGLIDDLTFAPRPRWPLTEL